MTSDSTELTFVRCPSCRSLVPAVSTRCRMCGSSLGVSEGSDEDVAPQDQSRVRKNTTSVDDSAPVVEQVRQDLEVAGEAMESKRQDTEASAEDLDEEELDEDLDFDDLDDDEDSFEDPLGEFIEEVALDDDGEGGDEDLLDESDEVEEPEEVVPPKPLVRVESGGGKRAGGLSFGGDKGLKRKEKSAKEAQPEKEHQTTPGEMNGHSDKSQIPTKKVASVEKREKRQKEETTPPIEPEKEKKPEVRKEQKAASVKSSNTGRLCGWFVSYSNPDGEAIELREGKFFVSGTQLKESDLVIDDSSLSTPHAIITLDSNSLMIQDLMSDRGVFVRKRGDDNYRREEEKVSVAHGDWVRFGDVEFLVTLVAEVGS